MQELSLKSNLKAVLVGVSLKNQPQSLIHDYLNELEFLAKTLNIEVKKKFIQKLEKPNPKTYVGKGKLSEIKEFIKNNQINLVIFDDDLPLSQHRNIEKELEVQIIDRTFLILKIFELRAKTKVAKLQVELAEYKYLLSKLVGRWTHLERQRGGIGLRGPGEKELETDKRQINRQIKILEEKLKKIDTQKQTQRKSRDKFVKVALVGYTNVGKSTLMNLLTKTDVLVENKLFATLDTTTRKLVLWNLPIIISDTVGFIRKLPTTLINAFKSTLDEVRYADILLHIVDISHPNFETHYNVVQNVLAEINASDKPTITVFNKIDQYKYIEKNPYDLSPKKKENYSLEELKEHWLVKTNKKAVFISALKKINIEELKKILYKEAREIHTSRYPYNDFLYPDLDDIITENQ